MGQSKYINKKGEKHAPGQLKPHAYAAKPLLLWKDPSKAQLLGRVLVALFSKGVKNPLLQVQNGAGGVTRKSVCFGFMTDPKSGCHNGCNGYQKNRKGHWVPCNCIHIDLAEDLWACMGKETYASLWEFLQHPAVQEVFITSAGFTTLMA